MKRWLKRLFCPHSRITNAITVSGYGYTEWQLWWCCDCDKCFLKQTREQQ
jgi:transposase-like protein